MEDDDYIIDISTMNDNGTITVSTEDIYSTTADGEFSFNLDNIFVSTSGTPFEDTMPDFYELKNMIEEYPALEKAYENFKTVYKMVEQDWQGKKKERGDNDFLSF
jgi:hypothetical protein